MLTKQGWCLVARVLEFFARAARFGSEIHGGVQHVTSFFVKQMHRASLEQVLGVIVI